MRKLSLSTAFAVVLVLSPLAAPAQETDQEREDRGYLTALLEDNLSGDGRQVIINGFKGALSSRATIQQMTIADAQGVWLTLNDVVLDWNRSALLLGNVSVNELTAREIILDRLPAGSASEDLPSPEATPFSLPELPVSVDIGRLSAPRIVLGEPVLGEPLTGSLEAQAKLSGGEGQVSLVLERTDQGPDGLVKLSGSFANDTRQLILDLSAQEGAGGIASRLIGLPGTPSVDLAVKGMGPLDDFNATIDLKSDGQDRLAGTVALKGAEDGAQGFAIDLGGDIAPLFLPDHAAFFGPQVKLVARGSQPTTGGVVLDELNLATQALNLTGSARIAADGLPEKLDLSMKIAQPDGQPVMLPISEENPVRVSSADLTLRFDAATGSAWSTAGHLYGLDQASAKSEKIEFLGEGQIAREVDGNQVSGKIIYGVHKLQLTDQALAAALGEWANGHVAFDWKQGGDGLVLPDIVLRAVGLQTQGAVTVKGLSGDMTITAKAVADVADLSRFSALAGQSLGGDGHIEIDGSYQPLSGAFDGVVNVAGQDLAAGIEQVDNLLKGRSTVALSAKRDETGTVLRNLAVNARTLSLTGAGTVATASSDISADLAFTDLSVLGAGYGGALTGKARLQGNLQDATVTLDATGSDLAINQREGDALLKGQSLLGVTVAKTGDDITIQRAEVTNPQLSAKASGTVKGKDQVMDLAAEASIPRLAVIGGGYRGALAAKVAVSGTMTDGRILADATGTDLAVGQTYADRILAGNSSITADLALQNGAIKINQAQLRNPQVTADATGAIEGDTRTVALDARLANLALLIPEFPGALTVKGTAVDSGTGARLDIALQGPGGIDVKVAGSLAPGYGSGDLTIRGTGQAALLNGFLDPRAISGTTRYDLRLNGPLALSSLSGQVALVGARVVDPSLAFAVEGLNVTANLGSGSARIDGRASLSSGGQLAVAGSVGLTAPYNADLTANAYNAILRDPSLFQTRASGEVKVTGPLTGGARIAGRITLAETELRIPSTGFGGAGALPDLRHFNEPAAVRATRARAGADAASSSGGSSSSGKAYPLDLLISAPNRVFIRGRGLDAELGGELRLAGTTANVVPSGGFELIRGRLDILGKRLDLTRATLRMEGDFNPDLDIAATTDSDGIAVGVAITGPATDPDVAFTSNPELPQEEVLARLLFGKGLDNISALQAAQLASAVMTLAGRGGVGIVGKLRSGFGLDNLDLQTDGEGGASVTAGKYLSKNLYTEVGVDSAGETEIHLNLDVSKQVTVRATAGSDGDSGLGIYYEHDY